MNIRIKIPEQLHRELMLIKSETGQELAEIIAEMISERHDREFENENLKTINQSLRNSRLTMRRAG